MDRRELLLGCTCPHWRLLGDLVELSRTSGLMDAAGLFKGKLPSLITQMIIKDIVIKKSSGTDVRLLPGVYTPPSGLLRWADPHL